MVVVEEEEVVIVNEVAGAEEVVVVDGNAGANEAVEVIGIGAEVDESMQEDVEGEGEVPQVTAANIDRPQNEEDSQLRQETTQTTTMTDVVHQVEDNSQQSREIPQTETVNAQPQVEDNSQDQREVRQTITAVVTHPRVEDNSQRYRDYQQPTEELNYNSQLHPEFQDGCPECERAGNRSSTAPEPAILRDYNPEEGQENQGATTDPIQDEPKILYGSESTSEDSSEEDEDEFGGFSGNWGDVGLEAGIEEILLREEQPPPPGDEEKTEK